MGDGNFYALLRSRFADSLDAPMLTLPNGRKISYREMDVLAARFAGAFQAAGARPGDRVLVQVDKSSENVGAYLGAMRAGLIYTPLNTAYTDDEVAYFLNDAEPTVCVFDQSRAASLGKLATSAKKVFTLGADGAGTLTETAMERHDSQIQPRHEDDLSAILYTSGTTGRSKGAMLSHGALAANATALNRLWEFSERDVLLHALPIFHIHGLFVALHTAMLSACEILFLPKFEVTEVHKLLPRASVMMGVPTFYTRLLSEKNFGQRDAENMRLFISGSAPLTKETHAAFKQRTGHKILERYGMSEAGMIASNPLDGERRAGTVGFDLPGVSIRITDNEGAPAPTGEAGNVEIKSDSLFKGYWRMPEKTTAEFRDDWFVTGDIGSLDADGRLTLSGRAKDLIIAGGYNIYPKEIEEVLDAVPGVEESAVIGAPHQDLGEGVVAMLVGKADDDALVMAVEKLAKFKRPRKFFYLDALPRNAMGKVQKHVLRDRYVAAFTADEKG